MTALIRIAEERDIYPMAELDKICFSIPWSQKAFEQEIMENQQALYLVAENEGQIIGYAGLWGILEEGHITNVAVHPDYRCKGLGELLVSKLIEISKDKGIDKYTLEVRVSNYEAIALYRKLGFQPAGRRLNYYEDVGEDALIMWRFCDSGVE